MTVSSKHTHKSINFVTEIRFDHHQHHLQHTHNLNICNRRLMQMGIWPISNQMINQYQSKTHVTNFSRHYNSSYNTHIFLIFLSMKCNHVISSPKNKTSWHRHTFTIIIKSQWPNFEIFNSNLCFFMYIISFFSFSIQLYVIVRCNHKTPENKLPCLWNMSFWCLLQQQTDYQSIINRQPRSFHFSCRYFFLFILINSIIIITK